MKSKRIILLMGAVIILNLLVFPTHAFAEKKVIMPDLLQPKSIHVDEGRIFIAEQDSVKIYRDTDFKLLKTFGKGGEGPREFKTNPEFPIELVVRPDHLVIYSIAKSSYYKKDGTFIKEKREKGEKTYFIVGDNYLSAEVIRCDDKRDYIVNYIYDSNYRKIKEITRFLFPLQTDKKEIYFFNEKLFPVIYKDRFYYVNGTSFQIDAYDFEGKKRRSITYPYKRDKITEDQIEAVHEEFRTNHPNKNLYNSWKSFFRFPEYFPAIKDFVVVDDLIYVKTYRRKGDKTEFVVLSTDGTFKNKYFLPVSSNYIIKDYPYSFKDGKLYHLVDDVDNEEWVLHIMPLK